MIILDSKKESSHSPNRNPLPKGIPPMPPLPGPLPPRPIPPKPIPGPDPNTPLVLGPSPVNPGRSPEPDPDRNPVCLNSELLPSLSVPVPKGISFVLKPSRPVWCPPPKLIPSTRTFAVPWLRALSLVRKFDASIVMPKGKFTEIDGPVLPPLLPFVLFLSPRPGRGDGRLGPASSTGESSLSSSSSAAALLLGFSRLWYCLSCEVPARRGGGGYPDIPGLISVEFVLRDPWGR